MNCGRQQIRIYHPSLIIMADKIKITTENTENKTQSSQRKASVIPVFKIMYTNGG